MKKVALFEKVPFAQYRDDLFEAYGGVDRFSYVKSCESYEEAERLVRSMYDDIKLPTRATVGSAGYDFYAPEDYIIEPDMTVVIPSGIRVIIEPGWVLNVFPRSGHGFKYRLQLDNTVGIIDSDYYGSDNFGHIKIKLTNDTKCHKTCVIEAGCGYAQGIFIPYGITFNDQADAIRNGGFGSTTERGVEDERQ